MEHETGPDKEPVFMLTHGPGGGESVSWILFASSFLQ
jgi:hypothetical protein